MAENKTVKVHPEVLTDIAEMEEGEQKEMLKVMAAFSKAASLTPKGAPEGTFEEHLKAALAELGVTNVVIGPADDMTEEESKIIQDRKKNWPVIQ